MNSKDVPENLNLIFKEIEDPEVLKGSDTHKDHTNVGPSSLYGRRGDNITFHTQGTYVHGYRNRMWHWAWKDLGAAFGGLFRIFFSRKD